MLLGSRIAAATRGPEREVCHPRQLVEVHAIQGSTSASSSTPRMWGRAISNSRHSSLSGRRCASRMGARVLTQRDVDEHTARQALGCRLFRSSASEIGSEAGSSAGRSGSIRPKACPTLIGAIVKAQVFVTDLAQLQCPPRNGRTKRRSPDGPLGSRLGA